MNRSSGFTLLELLVVVAIVGVMGALGITNLPRDRIQVREATRIISADLNRARSEAIRLNTEIEVSFNTDTDCYTLSETRDQDDNPLATARRVLERCVSADFPLADVSAASFGGTTAGITKVSFNSRGLPTTAQQGTVTVQSSRNTSYSLRLTMAPQGRVTVQ